MRARGLDVAWGQEEGEGLLWVPSGGVFGFTVAGLVLLDGSHHDWEHREAYMGD